MNVRSRARKIGDGVVNALVVLCAIIAVARLLREEPVSTPQLPDIAENWAVLAELGNIAGPRDAPLSIFVFGDYECPACRNLEESLALIRNERNLSVRIVYLHYPLEYHANAIAAARMADCAAEQGAFEPMHQSLFRVQGRLASLDIGEIGALGHVPDVQRFRECVDQQRTPKHLDRVRAEATKIRLTGTPTLLINGRIVRGAPPAADLLEMVKAAR